MYGVVVPHPWPIGIDGCAVNKYCDCMIKKIPEVLPQQSCTGRK